LPSISGAAMPRMRIAASESRMATTSPVMVAVRYFSDALYKTASPRDAHDPFPRADARARVAGRNRDMWAAIQRRHRSQSSAAEASQHPFRVGGLVLGSDARERTQFPVSHRTGRPNMSVYDVVEIIGSSSESWEKATANAVEQASKSLRDLRIAEITELDMQLDAKGKVEAYRAKVKLSFKYEGS